MGIRRWLLLAVLAVVTSQVAAGGGRPHARPDAGGLHRVGMGGHDMPVLVVPQRPGWNLVLLQGDGAAAGTDRQRLTTAAPRPGAAGRWALVRLPAGSSRLWIREHGHLFALTVETGDEPARLDLSGPDGPECADALLGRLLAGDASHQQCPADALSPADAAALRGTVEFIAARGTRALTLVGDGSRRSAAATGVVRGVAARVGMTVMSPDDRTEGPALVVSGWATAAAELDRIVTNGRSAQGGYLAPWLLSAPLLTVPAGMLIPLNFAPDDALPRRYLAALRSGLPGMLPSGSGYAAWLAARGAAPAGAAIHLYAPAWANLPFAGLDGKGGHGRHGTAGDTTWLPGGRLTAVSLPLPAVSAA